MRVSKERIISDLSLVVTVTPATKPVSQRKFFVAKQKSFDVVEEGSGVRVYKNRRGYRKSMFLQQEDVEWFLKS